MDFLICGMPRGGTTFFGQLFNAHEDVYCYFMETGLIRHLFMFGRDRPFPAENLPVLEQWLRTEMWPTLVDGTKEVRVAKFRRLVKFREILREHGLDESSGPGIRAWDEQSFESFLQDVLALYRSGAYGAPLFLRGMQLLRRYLGDVTGRPVIGEKTPDNLFYIETLQKADPSLKGLCILREPYSTLESMKRRALRSEAFFDSAFSTDVLRGIAEYYRHINAAHVNDVHAEPGRFHVFRFEDLVEDPVEVMARAFNALDLRMTSAACDILPRLSIPTSQKHLIDLELTPGEYHLVELILGPMLRHFGYECTDHAARASSSSQLKETILPLAGIYPNTDADGPINFNWMAKCAELFLLFGGQRTALILDLKFVFPEGFEHDLVELGITSSGVTMATCEVTPGQDEIRVSVPLDVLRERQPDSPMVGAPLSLHSSASYAPITISGLGSDVRDVSFLIKSCAFE